MIHLVAVTSLSLSWPWYVVRAAGVVAVVLLGAVTLSGIGMVTGLTYRFLEPLRAWALHRTLAIALALATIAHIGFLLIDKFAPYSLTNVFVPFSVHYEHSTIFGMSVGSLYNALGILGAYLLLIIMVSSLFIIETHKRQWRWLHYLSYPLAVMVFFHVLFLGTDFKHGIGRLAWAGVGLVLVAGFISRLRRTGAVSSREM
ncbi:MAG TPA: ferric reductase-like transmembrane domain-containing protein [Candidatus Saccharimonadales bacterium]|nr:ferric reductase-like transmembrane domain-containing protein [Candidatus Saccharimonadales bacterium]